MVNFHDIIIIEDQFDVVVFKMKKGYAVLVLLLLYA
jgi:hypothetical protein